MSRPYDLIIIGGGLTGTIIALLLSSYRPDVHVLLIEASESCGGGTLETALWDDIPKKVRPVIDGAIVKEWDYGYLAYPCGSERRDARVIMVDPTQLHLEVLHRISPVDLRLNSAVHRITGGTVEHASGIDAGKVVIDARESETLHGLNVLMQSKHADFNVAHELEAPVLADLSLDDGNWTFQQYFPVDPTKMLIRHFGVAKQSSIDGGPRGDQYIADEIIRKTTNSINADQFTTLPSLDLIPSRLKLASQIGNALIESPSFEKKAISSIFQHLQNESKVRSEEFFAVARDLRSSVSSVSNR